MCPFCDATTVALGGAPARRVPPPGLAREALAVFGALVAANTSGCALVHTRPEDTYYGASDAAYGGHDGGPITRPLEAGPPDADRGGSDAAYGGHDGGTGP